MAPRMDLVLFLDCEMTGNQPEDEIIEIGLSMVETEGLTEIASYTSILLPSDVAFMRLIRNSFVRKMHEDNGLLGEIMVASGNQDHSSLASLRFLQPESVDVDMVDWLDEIVAGDTTHVLYGGSGVAHFDRPYLDKTFHHFVRRISYNPIDIGPSRRMYEMAGKDWPSQDSKTHRALDDARFHADEFRYAMGHIRELG